MKNTKMKYKIFFLMMLLIISLNNVTGALNEGSISSASYIETDGTVTYGGSGVVTELDGLYIHDGAEVGGLQSVFTYMDADGWVGSENGYGKSDVVFEYDGTYAGEGYMYFWQMNTDETPGYDIVYIKVYIENGLIGIPSGQTEVDIVGDITSQVKFDRYRAEGYPPSGNYNSKFVGLGRTGGIGSDWFSFTVGEHTSRIAKSFYNAYTYEYIEYQELFEFNIYRDVANRSQIKIINNGGIELINETSMLGVDAVVVSDDIINSTWYFTAEDNLGYNYARTFEFIETPEDLLPTLTTDKLLYNTSEQITISFTNIDEIEGYVGESLSLYILYPIIHESKDYDAKYMLHLLGDKRDETFTLNTSFLAPQNQYHLAVCIDGDFNNIDDALIISDDFYVYSEGEYLNTNCDPTGNCYTYNNNDITIYYRINNNSDIIIKDNDGNTIQTYYNIIDEGEINYHIPSDENKLNSYPNWKIYLNNTEYSTSYNTDVTVYWSLFVKPTPTPVYTVDIPDENVSEQIDQLKEESKPIFDLIYGLTTLVIDNPDYDNDNIVDEHEINNWFNSLIPLGILLLLIILYMGLKKRD